jgi:photosystem II stability/assembly factor-like uncharacterized protein
VDLSFIDPRNGWLLGAACQGNFCPATMRVTHDGGKSWAGLPGPAAAAGFFPKFPWHAGDPAGVSNIRFASAQDGWAFGPDLYSTHDGGQTWLKENRLVSDVAVTNGAVWAVEQKGTAAVVERSTDTGKAWAPVKMQPLLVGWPTITSVDKETAWLFTQDSVLNPQLIVTNDGGNTWVELQMPARPCPTAFVKAITALVLWYICGGVGATAMQDKGVYTSSNGGISWTLQADSLAQNPANRSFTKQGHILSPKQFAAPSALTAFMALDRGTLIMTKDGGHHWTDAIPYERANGGSDPAMGPVEFANAHNGWLAVGPNRLFRTKDGGHTWTDAAVP